VSGIGPDEMAHTLARASSSIGEVALRRRGAVTELIVNGTFVMDTVDVSTEVELATGTLSQHPAPDRVLVGGLGLGFTAATVLADPRVRQVKVVEIAEPLVEWAETGLLPTDLADPRVYLRAGDVGEVLRGGDRWDLILLDVDNGPGFLVREDNAGLYSEAGVSTAYRALAPGGVLAIWSSHLAPELVETMRVVGAGARGAGRGNVQEIVRTIVREGRSFEYAIYLLRRPLGEGDQGGVTDLVPSPLAE